MRQSMRGPSYYPGKRRLGELLVVPLSYFTEADVGWETGGEFLRRVEWLLDRYHEGAVVVAAASSFGPRTDRKPLPECHSSPLQCPLGRFKTPDGKWSADHSRGRAWQVLTEGGRNQMPTGSVLQRGKYAMRRTTPRPDRTRIRRTWPSCSKG